VPLSSAEAPSVEGDEKTRKMKNRGSAGAECPPRAFVSILARLLALSLFPRPLRRREVSHCKEPITFGNSPEL